MKKAIAKCLIFNRCHWVYCTQCNLMRDAQTLAVFTCKESMNSFWLQIPNEQCIWILNWTVCRHFHFVKNNPKSGACIYHVFLPCLWGHTVLFSVCLTSLAQWVAISGFLGWTTCQNFCFQGAPQSYSRTCCLLYWTQLFCISLLRTVFKDSKMQILQGIFCTQVLCIN